MKTLSAAWALAQKDLKSFVRDRAAVVLSILVPIALVSVFGWIMAYAFGGSGGMPKVSLHVADLANTAASERFVERLSQLDMLKIRRVTLDADSEQPASTRLEKLIRDGDANHVLIIPENYDQFLLDNQTPTLQMLRDPGRQMEERIVQLSIMQVAMSELGSTIWIDAMDRILASQGMGSQGLNSIRGWMTDIGSTISDFAEEKSISDVPATTPDENRDKDALDDTKSIPLDASASTNATSKDNEFDAQALLDFMSEVVPVETTDISPPNRAQQVTFQQAQSVAGMTVMMLLFALTSCGSVLLAERENGTLKRLFAQPISRGTVLLGKFLFVYMVGIIQMSILFLYGEWMFRVGLFRDPVTLIVLSLTWIAAGAAFGMFLASVSRSTKQAESLASLLILMMAALGGCWFPLQLMNLPPLLDGVCKSTMTYWAMTGFQGMLWNQLPWYASKMLLAIGWQWGWVVVLTSLSVFFYRRNYCRG